MKTQDEAIIETCGPGFVADKSSIAPEDFEPGSSSTPPATAGHADNPQFDGTVVGKLAGISESGEPLVHFGKMPAGSAIPARLVVTISLQDVGRQAVLLFENGDPLKPILMGLLREPLPVGSEDSPVEVRLDGESLNLTARQEIVLRCGKASITLTRAGKVLIRGAYLLSRSSGANRIKGGSVQIN